MTDKLKPTTQDRIKSEGKPVLIDPDLHAELVKLKEDKGVDIKFNIDKFVREGLNKLREEGRGV